MAKKKISKKKILKKAPKVPTPGEKLRKKFDPKERAKRKLKQAREKGKEDALKIKAKKCRDDACKRELRKKR